MIIVAVSGESAHRREEASRRSHARRNMCGVKDSEQGSCRVQSKCDRREPSPWLWEVSRSTDWEAPGDTSRVGVSLTVDADVSKVFSTH